MKMKWWGFCAFAAVVPAGFWVGACSSSSSGTTNPPTGDSGPGAQPCSSSSAGVAPGVIPPPNCLPYDDYPQTCSAVQGTCNLSGCQAKNTMAGSCEPLATNSGSTLNFRMRRIDVVAPASLASNFVQTEVVTPGVELKGETACGEASNGGGSFNWLLQVDKTSNSLKTGGAPISTDPFNLGYCFYNATTTTGQLVAPVTTPVTFTGSSFSTQAFASTLNVPIFANDLPNGMPDINNPIILPVRAAQLKNVTISPDGNCIGSFNPAALNSMCVEAPTLCTKWDTAGALGGYITLADADNVDVTLLSESLCVLLTGTSKNPMGKCTTAALSMGDYCSMTQSPGGCNDSFWLAANFAASAVNINNGSGVAVCNGGGPTDAGLDSPATTDAPSDATGQ